MKQIRMLVLWVLCVLCAAIASMWMLLAIVVGSPRAVLIAKAFDQLGNATGGGSEDELISSRAWRMRYNPQYARLVRFINWMFSDPSHCKDAFETEFVHNKEP